MTAHHRTPAWQRFTARVRPIIRASLPAPCVNRCHYGGIVHEGERFDVAHIVPPEYGGEDTIDNVGPAHPKCNRSEGGARGRAKQIKTKAEDRRMGRT